METTVVYGLYWDNGEENGNYCSTLGRVISTTWHLAHGLGFRVQGLRVYYLIRIWCRV